MAGASAADRSAAALLGYEAGLEVRQWIVADDPERITEAVLAHRDGEALDSAGADRLRRNGFRLFRIPQEEVEALEAAMGFASVNRTGWHGQVLEWQPLHRFRVEPEIRAIAVDGRIRRYEQGEFRLMHRAWIVPLEDGPRLGVQLVSTYQLPQVDTYARILGRQDRRGDTVGAINLDLLLEPGYAYVLTGERPAVSWTDDSEDPGTSADASTFEPATPAPGPDAISPQTLGELMFLARGTRPGRGLFILVPRIPAEFFPPDQSAQNGLTRGGSGR